MCTPAANLSGGRYRGGVLVRYPWAGGLWWPPCTSGLGVLRGPPLPAGGGNHLCCRYVRMFHAALKRRALDAFTTRCILELSFEMPRSSHRPGVTPAPTAQRPAREEGSDGDGELTGPAN